MEGLLFAPVLVTSRGESRRVPALEAIILQLLQQALAGNKRAMRTLMKYQEFASRHTDKSPELIFAESDYTTALAASRPGGGDG